MKVIVCLDDNQGMLFNKRRQSRDRKVIEDICTMAEKLWISPFSAKLLEGGGLCVCADESYLEMAGNGDYCFVEADPLEPHLHKIEEVIIYWWNRKYPTDTHLDLNLQEWVLKEQCDFAGFSHEKITKAVYVRR